MLGGGNDGLAAKLANEGHACKSIDPPGIQEVRQRFFELRKIVEVEINKDSRREDLRQHCVDDIVPRDKQYLLNPEYFTHAAAEEEDNVKTIVREKVQEERLKPETEEKSNSWLDSVKILNQAQNIPEKLKEALKAGTMRLHNALIVGLKVRETKDRIEQTKAGTIQDEVRLQVTELLYDSGKPNNTDAYIWMDISLQQQEPLIQLYSRTAMPSRFHALIVKPDGLLLVHLGQSCEKLPSTAHYVQFLQQSSQYLNDSQVVDNTAPCKRLAIWNPTLQIVRNVQEDILAETPADEVWNWILTAGNKDYLQSCQEEIVKLRENSCIEELFQNFICTHYSNPTFRAEIEGFHPLNIGSFVVIKVDKSFQELLDQTEIDNQLTQSKDDTKEKRNKNKNSKTFRSSQLWKFFL